mmetsp:Transcript_14771/g.35634  ORF Transcript_14771/g.35634 Transcript_14771/m.35634 type:complete len:578 (-) Transcript_14771:202-1935(-)
MGRKDSDLLDPVVAVDVFSFVEHTGLELLVTERNHTIRGTLDVNDKLVILAFTIVLGSGVVNSSHELVFGGEWNFSDDRRSVLHFVNLNTTPVGSTQDGKFSWVTNFTFATTILSKSTLRAKNTTSKTLTEERKFGRFTSTNGEVIGFSAFILGSGFGSFLSVIRGQVSVNNRSSHGIWEVLLLLSETIMGRNTRSSLEEIAGLHHLGVVSTFSHVGIVTGKVLVRAFSRVGVDLVSCVGSDPGNKGHLVLCKSSSLVRADGGNRSKSLDSGKSTDNGVLFGHVAHSPSVGNSHNSLKTFGDHSDSTDKSDRKRLKPVTLSFIGGEERDKESNNGGDDNEEGQPLGNIINLFQDSSLLVLDLVHKLVDGSNLGVVTSGNNQTNTGSLCDKSGTETHVMTVTKRDGLWLIRFNLVNSLINRNGFSGQSGLSTCQLNDFDHTKISGHTITKRKGDNITRDNLVGWNLSLSSVTDNNGIGRKHRLEGLSGLLGRTFLDDTNSGVNNNDANNNTDLDTVGNWIIGENTDQGDSGNKQEDTNKNVGNLFPDLHQESLLRLSRKHVPAVLLQTSGGFLSGETL